MHIYVAHQDPRSLLWQVWMVDSVEYRSCVLGQLNFEMQSPYT